MAWALAVVCVLLAGAGCLYLISAAVVSAGFVAEAAPESAASFPVTTPLFVILLIGVIIIVGGLTFFPAVALGPIVEQLSHKFYSVISGGPAFLSSVVHGVLLR